MSDEQVDDVGEIDPKYRVGELRYNKNGDAVCMVFACDVNGDVIDESGFLKYVRSLSEHDLRLAKFRNKLCDYGNALKVFVPNDGPNTYAIIPFDDLIIIKCSSPKNDKPSVMCDNCHADTYLPFSPFYKGPNYVRDDDNAVLVYCEHCCLIVEDHLFAIPIKEPAC